MSNNEEKGIITNRMFLSRIATLFDPPGFLAPNIIQRKMIMQDLWLQGLEWNGPPEEDMKYEFMAWCNKLEQISEIKVPKCLLMNLGKHEVSLHVFSDASKEAYAAVGYLKIKYKNVEPSRRLVAAKTKVAPMEATSTPRLELMAVLAVTLAIPMKKVIEKPEKFFY